MRRLPLLACLALGAAVGAAPPATAGTYPVAWTGSDLHGRFDAIGQYAPGSYRGADTPAGVRLETVPGTGIGAAGFAVRSLAAPAGSRFVDVTATTRACTAAPSMYAQLLSDAGAVIEHRHGAPVCTSRTGSARVDGQALSLVLGAGPSGAAATPESSSIELQSLSLLLADDVAPRDVTLAAAATVVGLPQVELHWSAVDDLSGVGAVELVQDGAGGPEIGGLPPADVRLVVGQRTGGSVAAAGSAVVALMGPGAHELRVRVVDGAGNASLSRPVRVSYVPAPAALAGPRVLGTAVEGGTISCDAGRWAEPAPTLSIAWRRDGIELPGAVGATYVPVGDDVGRALDCRVTATAAGVPGGAPTVLTSEPVRVAPAPSALLVADASTGGRALHPGRAATIGAGAVVRVVGQLRTAVPRGATVTVQLVHPSAPAQTWRVRVAASGRFTLALRPVRGGELIARFAGDASSGPAVRRLARIVVRPRISASFVARRLPGGQLANLAVHGRITPAPGVALRLVWQARPAAGGWQAFCRDADAIRVRADGRFSGRCRLPLRLYPSNRYRLVLPVQPDGPWAGAASPARRATSR